MLGQLVLVSCALLGQVDAGPKPLEPAQLAPVVRDLVTRLDASEKARRDAAEQELLRLGPAVLDLLPQPDDQTPAEVKLRLERVRSKLERDRAEGAVRFSTVTLQGDAIPLADVLAAIEKQTGNPLVDFRQQFQQESTQSTIKAAFDKTPFWQALDQVLDDAGLKIYNYAGEPGLAIVRRADNDRPRKAGAVYAGSFRLEAAEVNSRRSLRESGGDLLQVTLDAAWEPRLKPILLIHPAEAIEAVADDGSTLAVESAEASTEIAVMPNVYSADLPINFALPPRSAQKIATLKGRLSVLVPGRVETFRFTDLEKARRVEQRKGGATVVLDAVVKNNDLWEVRGRVIFDSAGGALQSHLDWISNNEATMEGPNKARIPFAAQIPGSQAENEATFSYVFDLSQGPKGHTFVYSTPVAVVSLPVEYEIKDLPLP